MNGPLEDFKNTKKYKIRTDRSPTRNYKNRGDSPKGVFRGERVNPLFWEKLFNWLGFFKKKFKKTLEKFLDTSFEKTSRC